MTVSRVRRAQAEQKLVVEVARGLGEQFFEAFDGFIDVLSQCDFVATVDGGVLASHFRCFHVDIAACEKMLAALSDVITSRRC